MTEKFAYEFVSDIQKLFEERNKSKLFPEIAGNIARKAKRLAIHIMSEGLPRAILFAYSKAKEERIKNFADTLSDVIEKLESDNKKAWTEAHDWLVVCKFALNFLKKNYGGLLGLSSDDLEHVLEKLIQFEEKRIFIEEILVRALNSLSMLCFAMEKTEGGEHGA